MINPTDPQFVVKALGLLMHQAGINEFIITQEDVEAIAQRFGGPAMPTVLIDVPEPENPESSAIRLRLMSVPEAQEIIRKHDEARGVYSHSDCVFQYCPHPDACNKPGDPGCLQRIKQG